MSITRAVDTILSRGGPPCPQFSYAGPREGTDSEQGRLYKQLLRIADEASARVVVMENVEGLLTVQDGKAFQMVIEGFKSFGFHGFARVFDCSLYGVPQLRRRLIIFGARNGLRINAPEPRGEIVSVRQALGLRGAYAAGRLERAQSSAKGKERGWWQGGRALDVEKPGYTVGTRDNYDLLVPLDDVGRNEVRAMDRTGKRFTEKGYRLDVEQLRAIQGAPEYKLAGPRKWQHYAVGNMVPPPLGEAIGESVMRALRGG